MDLLLQPGVGDSIRETEYDLRSTFGALSSVWQLASHRGEAVMTCVLFAMNSRTGWFAAVVWGVCSLSCLAADAVPQAADGVFRLLLPPRMRRLLQQSRPLQPRRRPG